MCRSTWISFRYKPTWIGGLLLSWFPRLCGRQPLAISRMFSGAERLSCPSPNQQWLSTEGNFKYWIQPRINHCQASSFLHPPPHSSEWYTPFLWCQYAVFMTKCHKQLFTVSRIEAIFLWSPYVLGQTIIFMAALCNRGDYIFALWLLLSIVYLFFPRLISAATDRISTILLHMAWP